MRNRLKKIMAAMLVTMVFLTFPVCAADSGAGTMTSSVRTFIASGLSYYSRTFAETDGKRQKSAGLELSPNGDVYPIVMACDTIWGGLTMDAMVGYAQQQGYNVVGAVNTAFYNSPGVPIGIVVENGVFKSSSDGLHAFAIMNDGSYYISRDPQVDLQLSNVAWGSENQRITQFNKLFTENGLYMYSSAYSTVSTRVDKDETVWAVRLLIEEGALTLDGTVKLTVVEVLPETGAVPIGDEYMVLTASVDGPYSDLWRQFSVGDSVTLEISCSDEKLEQAKYITGCGDILVEDGAIADSTDWMHYIGGENPRTMIGWREDGTLVLYAAEGRNPGTADGLTLQMAAEEMLRQGCVYAVNMDGGGSTILGVRLPGQTTVEELNVLSDGGQRQCASYLLLVTDAQSDGVPKHWHLKQNHMTVLPNQQVRLSAFATDGALYPTNAEQSLVYGDHRGLLTENLFVAPKDGGTYRIDIWGENGYGEGEITVISDPTVLKVVDQWGRMPRAVHLAVGDKLPLRVIASHNGAVISADHTAITYEMSTSLGYVDENNVFVADALCGTQGVLTVRIGDYSQQIQVTVGNSPRDASANRMKTALDYLNK